MAEREIRFLFWCPSCKKNHRMSNQPCHSCNGRGGWTPQPVSQKVKENCGTDYDCDGCMAYRNHLR